MHRKYRFRSPVSAAIVMAGLVLAYARPSAAATGAHAFYQYTENQLYSDTANAKADIQAALVTARKYHRNVILDFGGNWCGDCKVLDIYMHQSPNLELLQQNFLVVHVNIGRYDKNLDVAEKYHIPLSKGVPALAVLNPYGKLLYSQRTGEFEDMRQMSPGAITAFLNRWKPASAKKS
ncbi:MAG: thioredoxin family protein [Acidobacteriaceae bacterium]